MKQKHKSIIYQAVFFFLCLAIGAFIGAVFARSAKSGMQIIPLIIEFLIFIPVLFILQIIIHEAGHMLAALTSGWEFLSFRIFKFTISRKDGKFHFSVFHIPGTVGQCLMMPPEQPLSRSQLSFYNMGGVLANLCTAVIALLLLFVPSINQSSTGNLLVVLFAFAGILMACSNGIPLIGGGIPNDGMNNRMLKQDPLSRQVFIDVMRINGFIQQGIRVKDIPSAYFHANEKLDCANTIQVMACFYQLARALDQLNFEEANRLADEMGRHKKDMVYLYQQELTCEEIFLRLIRQFSKQEIERLLTTEMQKYIHLNQQYRPSVLRLAYALAKLYEQDEAKAEQLYQQFDHLCKHYHMVGEIEGERALVEYIKQL